jgi:hypothetical protein
MTRFRIKEKPLKCEGCNKDFGDILTENNIVKYHARNKCNPCYQKTYLNEKNPAKVKSTCCIECKNEFGSKIEKGRIVKKGSRGYCKRCYMRIFTQVGSKTCAGCGNEMTSKRLSLCPVCKLNKKSAGKWKRKERTPDIIDNETFELIRRLLARYKVGHNNMADAFRVIDVYMDVADNTNLLDNLREDYQIIEMLKWLKLTFDFNAPLVRGRYEAEIRSIERQKLKASKKQLKY